MIPNRFHNESGAVYSEYVLTLAVLITVFVAAAAYFQIVARTREERSTEVVQELVPCARDSGGGALSGDECL